MAETETIVTIFKSEVDGYLKGVTEIRTGVKDLGAAEKQQANDATKNATTLQSAAQKRKQLLAEETANLKKLQTESKKAFTVKEIEDYNRKIAQTTKNIAVLKGETGELNRTNAQLKNSFNGIGSQIAAAFSVVALVAFGKEAVSVSAKFKSIELALNFVEGSAEKGAEAFDFIRELSEKLGLELLSTAQAFKLFSASAQLAGISSDETREIFTNVSGAVTALGLSSEDAQGVFLALSQVISKGTVAAEELRGQIGERLPGAFELAAKSMGVTTKELNKMLEQGQVVAKDFLPKFSQQLKETFSGALPTAVNSSQANINRLTNLLTEFKNRIGGSLSTFIFGEASNTNIFKAEQVGLQDLIIKINDVNTSQEDRIGLIELLQSKYPEYLKNIKADSVTNEELDVALTKVNDNLINKIVLQKEQDKINKQVAETKEFQVKLAELESDALSGLLELSEKTGIALNNRLSLTEKILDLDVKIGDTLEDYQKTITLSNGQIVDLETLLTAINRLRKLTTDEEEKSLGLQTKKLEIEKKLGIETKKTTAEGFTGPIVPTLDLVELEKQLAALKLKLSAVKFDLAGNEIVPGTKDKILKDIAATQKLIDEINGKAGEERLKKQKDLTEKILADEKKLRDEINKLKTKGISDPVEQLEAQAKIDIELLAESKASQATKEEFIKERTIALNNAILELTKESNKKLNEEAIKGLQEQAESQDKFFRDQLEKRRALEESAQEEINLSKLDKFKAGSLGFLEEEKRQILEKQAAEIEAVDKSIFDVEEAEIEKANIRRKFREELVKNEEATIQKQIEIAQNFLQVTVAIIDAVNQLSQASTDIEIERLNERNDAFNESLDAELAALETQRQKKLIGEGAYQTKLADIEKRRIASSKAVDEAIRKEKIKAAKQSQLLTIFKIGLEIALAIASQQYVAAAIGAVQLAIVKATPIPKFAKGSKKTGEGPAIVGEKGPELIWTPMGSKILPAKQTAHHADMIEAMRGNNLQRYIDKTYVMPRLIAAQKEVHVASRKVMADTLAESITNSTINYMTDKSGSLDEYGMRRALGKGVPLSKGTIKALAELIANSQNKVDYFRL